MPGLIKRKVEDLFYKQEDTDNSEHSDRATVIRSDPARCRERSGQSSLGVQGEGVPVELEAEVLSLTQ
ncbi:hypothetical protein J6590_068790 [Homalodisca vitripennis]|nr:hypothetical protein J6590_068790 [Homalodisca vitripennis]